MDLAQSLGWIATIIFSFCAIPQIIKMLKRKTVDDISPLYWALFLAGNVDALAYAIVIKQPPLIFKYIWNFGEAAIILGLYLKYRKAS